MTTRRTTGEVEEKFVGACECIAQLIGFDGNISIQKLDHIIIIN